MERVTEDNVGEREGAALTGPCKPCKGVYNLCWKE